MIYIDTDHITSRLSYLVKVIFQYIYQVPYCLTEESGDIPDKAIIIHYRATYSRRSSQEIYLPKSGLLDEIGVIHPGSPPVLEGRLAYLYPDKNKQNTLHYDLFAACFFFLSRYEEYTTHAGDKHQRFSSSQSLLSRHKLLQHPIVNQYAEELKSAIIQRHPGIKIPHATSYQMIPTVDVDIPYAYQHKTWFRYFLSIGKNLLTNNRTEIRNTLSGRHAAYRDPYDTYAHITALEEQYEVSAYYFFPTGSYGKYDKHLSWKNKAYRKLMQDIHKQHAVGMHLSYSGWKSLTSILKEKKRLEHILGDSIERNRNHFLRTHMPDTFAQLAKAGIKEDYSLCFHDHYGFRAGICVPYPFYNLQEEYETSLLLYPTTVMDETLLHYMQLSVEEACSIVQQLIQTTKQFHGYFIPLFHNHSLSSLHPELRMLFRETIRLGR